ncbi:MAG: hypothetical protein PGN15_03925, partial [Aeromicrobium erythreum]
SATDATAGLTLMGARLYNPTRGLFTSIDPIEGGSDSAYAYPTDPINQLDLDGKAWYSGGWNAAKWVGRKAYKHRNKIIFGTCVVSMGTACTVATGIGIAVAGYSSYRKARNRGYGYRRSAWAGAKSAASSYAWARLGYGVNRGVGYGYRRHYGRAWRSNPVARASFKKIGLITSGYLSTMQYAWQRRRR